MTSGLIHQRVRLASSTRRVGSFAAPGRLPVAQKEADVPQKPSSKAELRDLLDIDFHGTFVPWAKVRMTETWHVLPDDLQKDYVACWAKAKKLFASEADHRRELLDTLTRHDQRRSLIDILPYAQKALHGWSAIDWIWEILYVSFSLLWDEAAEELIKTLPKQSYDSSRLMLRKVLILAQFRHYPQALSILTSGAFRNAAPEVRCVADQFFALLTKTNLQGEKLL